MRKFAKGTDEHRVCEEENFFSVLPLQKEKFDTPDTAFIVIDAVNGFLKHGALADPGMSHILPVIRAVYDAIPAAQKFAFCDSHTEQSEEFRNFPPHCVTGTEECDRVEELRDLPFQIIAKNSTNGFFRFYPYLQGQTKFLTAGDCTDLCVMQFALTLKAYLQEKDLPSEVAVIVNATDTFDSPSHPKTEMNRIAFRLLAQSGIILLKYEEKSYAGHQNHTGK